MALLAPELITSLANAVAFYFEGKYPADNSLPVSATSKSVVLFFGRAGRDFKKNISRNSFSKAMQNFRLHEPAHFDILKNSAKLPLKRYYSRLFYLALQEFWTYLEVLIDEDK